MAVAEGADARADVADVADVIICLYGGSTDGVRNPDSRLRAERCVALFNAGRVVMWWATPWLDPDSRAALLV